MIFRETESFRDYPVKQKCAGLPAHFFCSASFLYVSGHEEAAAGVLQIAGRGDRL